MDDKYQDYYRDCPMYQTGNTRPPKKHRGFIPVILVLLIVLGGILSVMGGLSVFPLKNTNPSGQNPPSLSFFDTSATDATAPTSNGDGQSLLQLQPAQAGVENIPQEGGLSLQEIYRNTIDSVVSISCIYPNGSSSGTGVVLSEDGYVLTNRHVIDGAQAIQARFTDGTVLAAKVVGTDAPTDLAILQVASDRLIPAVFGDSAALQVGDTVVAIGDPLGVELRGTMTDGIVSAINRDISSGGKTMTLIQTNAALNSGNSGGPLINCYGQVVGINTMKIGDSMSVAGVEGLGFAIPSTTVKEVVDQLLTQGFVSGRPSLGIQGETVSGIWQLYYQIPQGVYIRAVEPGSDAEKKGLSEGDVLVSFDGYRVKDADTLINLLASHQAGESVTLGIYRAGRQYDVSVMLEQAQ